MKCRVYFLGITEVELNADDILNSVVGGNDSGLVTTTEQTIEEKIKDTGISLDYIQGIYRNGNKVYEYLG